MRRLSLFVGRKPSSSRLNSKHTRLCTDQAISPLNLLLEFVTWQQEPPVCLKMPSITVYCKVARFFFQNRPNFHEKKLKNESTKLLNKVKHSRKNSQRNQTIHLTKPKTICFLKKTISLKMHLVHSQWLHKAVKVNTIFRIGNV